MNELTNEDYKAAFRSLGETHHATCQGVRIIRSLALTLAGNDGHTFEPGAARLGAAQIVRWCDIALRDSDPAPADTLPEIPPSAAISASERRDGRATTERRRRAR